MTDIKATRLSKIAREFNVGITTIVEFLQKKGVKIDSNPNTKISDEQYNLLQTEFSSDFNIKKESERVNLRHLKDNQQTISINDINEPETENGSDQDEVFINDHSSATVIYETDTEKNISRDIKLNVVGKIDLEEKKKVAKVEPIEKVESVEKFETPAAKSTVVADKKVEAEEIKEPIPEIIEPVQKHKVKEKPKEEESQVKVVGRIDLDSMNQRTRPPKKTKEQKEEERKVRIAEQRKYQSPKSDKQKEEVLDIDDLENSDFLDAPIEIRDEIIRARAEKLSGPTVVGRIELPSEDRKSTGDRQNIDRKKKRKRIKKDKEKVPLEANKTQPRPFNPADKDSAKKSHKKRSLKQEVSEEDVQKQIKDTLLRLTSKGKSKGSKHRRDKRDAVSQRLQEENLKKEESKNILQVTEFVSVNELATMMNVQVTEVIATCMNFGLFVSINQRLDAETMSLVAGEFGFSVSFVSVENQESIMDTEDSAEDLKPRPPIVTVMGHVDHGKTKLLDFIRSANVIEGEAGGITQHIGAYGVNLENGKSITFLDTPGHEAFTAMRARGAQVTDIVIIVVAADDGIKPQTVEAINHAQAAGVPMIFAINKIDKQSANPEKVKEELANMNLLVEDWGGKYQSQEISAKSGKNIELLLEKVLLEAEMLELKANPDKFALGTVVESSLDKGRGYVATVLVQAGTLRVGDILLAGAHTGKVKAMYNERGKAVKEAGPSAPVLVLGLSGAPQAGDKFHVLESEREAREIANKREQLQREQGLRAQKHITLDEIGRRIAIGNFQELNIIVKGDVDGSVEALSDSLIKLSTPEIQVNIIHKAVGQISEGDVLLAAASNAIVVGFQVRPSLSARKLAEKEEIDVRIYSIIYDAIDQIRSAMEGMLSPEIKEEINSTLEIIEVFNITKVGTIAGCMVKEGKIKRDSKIRVIRDGIVIFTGKLGSLKRFKDEVKEVVSGLECGLNINNFNDMKVGDILEGFEEFEVKKKL
jgi:translation initiation factor IF-2